MPFRRVNTILIPSFSTLALQLFRSPTTLWNRRSSPYTAPTSHPFSLMRFCRSSKRNYRTKPGAENTGLGRLRLRRPYHSLRRLHSRGVFGARSY